VRVSHPVVCGENIVPQAAEAKRGDCLLPSGTRLHYAAIGVAASAGTAQLRVYRQPLVALLATGDEVVEIEAVAGPARFATRTAMRSRRKSNARAECPSCCPSLAMSPDNCAS
jgi:molybdopterin biosynthesis enzyme